MGYLTFFSMKINFVNKPEPSRIYTKDLYNFKAGYENEIEVFYF